MNGYGDMTDMTRTQADIIFCFLIRFLNRLLFHKKLLFSRCTISWVRSYKVFLQNKLLLKQKKILLRVLQRKLRKVIKLVTQWLQNCLKLTNFILSKFTKNTSYWKITKIAGFNMMRINMNYWFIANPCTVFW